LRHFAGLLIPAESDVRDGVEYGPAGSLTGTLVSSGDVPDLSGGNLSQFETSETVALDSYYDISGVDAEYWTRATADTHWVVVLIKSRQSRSEQDGNRLVQIELLTVLIRRYGSTGVELPAVGDRISMVTMGVTRVYSLTDTPLVSVGQLEYQAEFARSVERSKGSKTRLV
jgi:hypothetical protein